MLGIVQYYYIRDILCTTVEILYLQLTECIELKLCTCIAFCSAGIEAAYMQSVAIKHNYVFTHELKLCKCRFAFNEEQKRRLFTCADVYNLVL